ncbi:hypothetical protein EG68_02413 [Paragonimus skrjabini miyazakii]|uniref:SEC7 domain-containing protein n=1 Tax=Paragonimus skrjabini miyazakii TaxID=59628 RepID=A0A8S9YYG8_9TREM|nr:hypothetical protein EG68_02413 [Paragonimus skrjabini miyazakii]
MPTSSTIPGPCSPTKHLKIAPDNSDSSNHSTFPLPNNQSPIEHSAAVSTITTEISRQPQLTVSTQAFSMFLVKAIEKIAAERETKKSQNATLRKACEEALQLLKKQPEVNNKPVQATSGGSSCAHLPPLRSDTGVLMADDRLLRPFQLACAMKSAKIVTTAVDSLQKLIAYGHVPNEAVGATGKVRIIEQVVTTICSCFQGVQTDDGVQLQVLKALLTVVTSSVVEIHEADILLVVRTCYNIFMATKNPVNQATARATLTQIISIIFQRMEHNALEAALALTSPCTSVDDHPHGEREEPTQQSAINDAYRETNHEPEVHSTTSGDSEVDASVDETENGDLIVRSILDEIIQHPSLGEDGQVHLSTEATTARDHDPSDGSSLPSPEVNGLSNGTAENINEKEAMSTTTHPEAMALAHVTQKDAFLVFRSLCRLATKEFGGSRSSDAKSNAIRSKTLSLQLLLSLFQQPGALFLSSEIFITAIKQYLCVALIKNGISPVAEVCQLSVSIFLSLLTHFKPHLKRQIEVFVKDVFLEILDSPKSTFEHKWVVMEALRRICADAQCVVDIYLNYDCDMNMANLFERLTTSLAKIAQGRYAVADPTSSAGQRQAIRTSGLECLVLILRCMVDWSHELYMSPESQSFLGTEPTVVLVNEVADRGSAITGVQTTNATTTPKAVDDPGDFESRKAQKELYESGINFFNQGKMAQGLHLLQQHGLLKDNVEAIAELLQTEDRLSKARIGDYLGENDPYNLRVMYAYVDRFDFAGKDFVPSMREFLAGFRLPGEAQKIDRLMEKFAARYCACNPNNGLFASADTAYVLAFSIIMLTTDLHSSQIKQHHRMAKEDYIRMNRGINDSQDLPEAYLAQIYDEIATCGIKLRSGDAVAKLAGTRLGDTVDGDPEDLRRSLASARGESVHPGHDDLLHSLDCTHSDFTSATHCEHVRPMFKLAWTPFLAAFSVGLQDCDALDVAHLCLEGIRYAIRIACIFHMEMERDAYVQALARFTLLLTTTTASGAGGSNSSLAGNNYTTSSTRRSKTEVIPTGSTGTIPGSMGAMSGTNAATASIPEAMKQKNIDTIRTLITVAQTDGNYLGHAWLEILRCISQLESTHSITLQTAGPYPTGSTMGANPGLLNRAATFAAPLHTSVNSNGPMTRRGTGQSYTASSVSLASQSSTGSSVEPVAPGSLAAASVDAKKAAILQEVMGETGSHSVVVAVDKIFTGSVRLNGDAIVDFVQALCQVSREELMLPHPRTFSLQKVVEISYYNMGRIRLQWSRVWEHIGGHFTAAGQSSNEDVAEFVLDSLRQLSVKLIEKGELPNFHFQKEFLRPFVSILDNGQNLTRKIQDMVIRCISHLVHSQYMNIRSGWTNIFAVFHRVASVADEAIVDMAFETCNFTVNEVLVHHLNVVLDAFQPLIKLLADFACNLHFPDMAMESIRLIRICAQLVSDHGSMFVADTSTPLSVTVSAGNLRDQEPVKQSDLSDSSVTYPRRSSAGTLVTLSDEDHVWLKGWMPVLCELFRVINSCKLDVRTRGLTVFFDILKTYGGQFKPVWWRETFTIIFRVFQHLRGPSLSDVPSNHTFGHTDAASAAANWSAMEQTEWMNTTCNHTLFSVVDVFTQFYDVLSPILLDEVYSQLRWCCLQEHEQLARSGTSCLETLILSTGKRFSHEIWERTVQLIVGLFEATVPHQLLTWLPDAGTSSEDTTSLDNQHTERPNSIDRSSRVPRYLAQARLFADLLIKCVVQYELIQTVDHILFYSSHSRNEDVHYLQEARALAAASYPAYSAALAAAAAVTDSGINNPGHTSWNRSIRRSSSFEPQWTPDESMDADETVRSKPDACWWLGSSGTRVRVGAPPLQPDPRGMSPRLSPRHRLTLAQCLLESHSFAKMFNSNDEQRNILFEAGFKVKAKPNLLKQETHSLLCSVRILFQLAEEETEIREETEELLDRVILEALAYYHSLVNDGHRQAWDTCLILIITQLTRLSPATRFHRHATRLYAGICDLVPMAGGVSPEVASLVRLFLLRCGAFFLPPSQSNSRSTVVV